MSKKYYTKEEILNDVYPKLSCSRKVEVLENALNIATMYPKNVDDILIEAMGFIQDELNDEIIYIYEKQH